MEFVNKDMQICPYNKSHIVCTLKFQHHLVKCRKNYPDIQLLACPYNATHLYVKKDLEEHLMCCPDKILIEPWRYNKAEEKCHGNLTPAPFNVVSNNGGWENC